MPGFYDYADYCDSAYDRECAYDDREASPERLKELETLDDLRENLKWFVENLNNGELVGRFNLQDALFAMCDLLDVNSKELEEKVKFHEVA